MRFARRGLHGQLVEIIARRILSGEIGEGETLDLVALQHELEVSLTAVREALKVLSAKGIVDARQKRGTFVRPRADWNLLDSEVISWRLIDKHDTTMLDNLHELRTIMEPRAARLAAERATDDDIKALDAALAEMTNGEGEAASADADLRFHRRLLAASRNELLERLEVAVQADLAEQHRNGGQMAAGDAVKGHHAVLDAIRARDPDAAERAMHDLLYYQEAG